MNYQTAISCAIQEALTIYGVKVDFKLSHPEDFAFGDYATNVALVLFPLIKEQTDYKSPRELAQRIKDKLSQNQPLMEFVDKLEVAGAGFINFFIKTESLFTELKHITSKEDQYGSNDSRNGEKVLTEFTDPNPFKEFHIGHLYSNTVGESLARIIASSGAEVKRANYQGDVGMHVAKSIWGLRQKLIQDNKKFTDLEPLSLNEKITYLGQAYALGATAYEEDHAAKQEIKQINADVYINNPSIMEMYQKGREWSLDYFETIYQRLGTKFDFYFFESKVGPLGLQFVKDQLNNGVFEQSDGAIIFKGEKYGLHTRVFVNAQGLPTYEAKDLGLSVIKYETYPYDLSIIITANEIDEYFKVVLHALSLIRPDLEAKTRHLSHGVVRLPEGKMSSRTGKIISGENLLQSVKTAALQLMQQTKTNISAQQIETVSEQVAVAAIKYAFLKSAVGKDIIYDMQASLNLQGNSGPYIQYTYARCISVLNKSTKLNKEVIKSVYDLGPEEMAVLHFLYRFPEVVVQAGIQFAPHLICTYLHELAQRFNTFYNSNSILQAKTQDLVQFRLLLTRATSIVLKNGLHLLGIQAPQHM